MIALTPRLRRALVAVGVEVAGEARRVAAAKLRGALGPIVGRLSPEQAEIAHALVVGDDDGQEGEP